MVQNEKKNRKKVILAHFTIHCPASEVVSEVSKAEQANEWAVHANEQTDKQRGPILISGFLIDLAHSEKGNFQQIDWNKYHGTVFQN